MAFLDRFKGKEAYEAEMKRKWGGESANSLTPNRYAGLRLTNKQKRELAKKEIEISGEIEKAARIKQITAEEQRKSLAFKQALKQQEKYGPGQFAIGGYNIPILGKISQHRNYQQEQDLKKAKYEAAIQFEKNRLQQLRQAGEVPQQQSGGFGNPLSMGGGFGMGMGLGPSQQEQPQQSSGGFNAGLTLPVIGGLGAGFGPQREEPQQVVPQYVRQAQYQEQEEPQQYTAYPSRVTRTIPVRSYEQTGFSVYRKIQQPYGASFKKIDPSEAIPGEKLYRRIRTPYGHKTVLIR
jgi:hypothetical protein